MAMMYVCKIPENETVNLRKTPNGAILTRVRFGKVVDAEPSTTEGWHLVTYMGMIGFMMSRFLCTDVSQKTGLNIDDSDVGQAIANYSSVHRDSYDHINVNTYLDNLERFAALRTVKYKSRGTSGRAPDYTAMCCASYPKISRNGRGEGGCTSQYIRGAATAFLQGTIKNLGGFDKLIPGMEVFQGDATTKSHMGVYYGKYDFGRGVEHAVYQSTSKRSMLKAKYEDENKEGPNLTQMNQRWKYWIWPKYVIQNEDMK